MDNLSWRNVKAYPELRRRFYKYLNGVQSLPEGWTHRRLFWDYLGVRRARAGQRVSISEYFIFAFYRMSGEEQDAYLTDYEATVSMRPYTEKAKACLWNKEVFLQTFSSFVHRDWMSLKNAGREEVAAFLSLHPKVAVKPPASSWGIGFCKLDLDADSGVEEVYQRYCGKDYLMEEYLTSDPALSRFHPASLNTIRIITFRLGARFQIFGAGLRVGNHGKAVDNAHGGGIFCEIDTASGRIITDGLDEYGNAYEVHPVTGVGFLGKQIPEWEQMTALCRHASECLPWLHIVGWDVALLHDGTLELIEGNHNPGMNIVQAPARHGRRSEFHSLIAEYFADRGDSSYYD